MVMGYLLLLPVFPLFYLFYLFYLFLSFLSDFIFSLCFYLFLSDLIFFFLFSFPIVRLRLPKREASVCPHSLVGAYGLQAI